jgi:hypothetical protein
VPFERGEQRLPFYNPARMRRVLQAALFVGMAGCLLVEPNPDFSPDVGTIVGNSADDSASAESTETASSGEESTSTSAVVSTSAGSDMDSGADVESSSDSDAYLPPCADVDLGSGIGSVYAGELTDGDRWNPSCGGFMHDDWVAVWTPPESGRFRFYTQSNTMDMDPLLALLETCSGPELACNDDDHESGSFLDSAISLDLDAGSPIIVVVDSLSGDGPFALYIAAE